MVDTRQETLGRRRFIASGAAVVGTVAATHALAPSVAHGMPVKTRHGPEGPDQDVETLLGLSAGMRVGSILVERVAIRDGAARIEAVGRGKRFRVDVLRRSRSPRGLAETDDFSLYLCNHGSGSHQTDEASGVGVLTLARYLQEARPEVPEYLLSYGERRRAHPERGR